MAAKLVLSAGLVIAVLLLTVLGVEAALRYVASPGLLRALLVAVGCIPAAALGLWVRLGPRVEEAILAPLDPGRAARREALEEVARAAAQPLDRSHVIAIAREALARISGAEVSFLTGPGRDEGGHPLGRRVVPLTITGARPDRTHARLAGEAGA